MAGLGWCLRLVRHCAFFFFSSRRRHTRLVSDWSSDVCSSDLQTHAEASAWVCYATGLGSSGFARAYDIIDAKLFALRRCERNSPVPVCILLWCRDRKSVV